MKILVLCYEYPPVGGGGGRIAAQVARGLAARGHEVRFLTAGLKHLPKREVIDGVEVLRPQSFRRAEDTCSVPEMGLYLMTALPAALQQAWGWKPDVVHAHFVVPTGVLALALRYLAHLPYVVTAHLGDVPGGVPEQTRGLFRMAAPLARKIWRRAAVATAVSKFVAGLAKGAFGRAGEVILNGLPSVSEEPTYPSTGPLRLVMVGRMSVQKNPLLAMESLALLPGEWTCDVVGDGPLAQATRDRAMDLGLGAKVKFHGWLSSAGVADLLKQSHVLLMTSLHEGLPMVAVEALQRGLAIVATRIGGMRDVVEDGVNGYLCDSSATAFAAALGELLNDRDKLATMRGASRAMAPLFDLENTVSAYEAALQEAAGHQNKTAQTNTAKP